MFIADYQKERTAKQIADMDRYRTRICTISMHTKTKLANLEKQKQKTLDKMRFHDIAYIKKMT